MYDENWNQNPRGYGRDQRKDVCISLVLRCGRIFSLKGYFSPGAMFPIDLYNTVAIHGNPCVIYNQIIKFFCMKAVITGASRGFGKAIAEEFAAVGYDLVLCSMDPERLAGTADALSKKFPQIKITSHAADLSNSIQIKAFAQWVLQQAGAIDVLVNNAGAFLPGNVSDEEEGQLEKMLAVNLYSAYHLTRALLPKLIRQKHGHVFNMCSIASLQAYKQGGSYSISKFALAGFSKNLREELKPHGIKVTAVYPGAAYTDSWAASGVDPARIMEAADIAKLIVAAAHLSTRACVEDIVVRPQLGDL